MSKIHSRFMLILHSLLFVPVGFSRSLRSRGCLLLTALPSVFKNGCANCCMAALLTDSLSSHFDCPLHLTSVFKIY